MLYRLPLENRGRHTSLAAGPTNKFVGPVWIRYAAGMRAMTDEQLMQCYANDDAQAFDKLYARHRTSLYRYLKRQLNDPATAGDLYQGVWEKVIRARRGYRPTTPFSAWLFTIAHNHLVDYYRRQRPTYNEATDRLVDERPGPVEDAVIGEQKQQLLGAIATLPPEQKNTLLLKLETGLKLEEIAKLTGVNRETVKSRLRYAVNKLRGHVDTGRD